MWFVYSCIYGAEKIFIYPWYRSLMLVNCWILLGWFLSFVCDSFFFFFFFFLLHSLVLFFVSGKLKRIEDGRKETRILLHSKLYIGVHNYSVVKMFSLNSKSSNISQTRCWNILESFLVSCRFGVCLVGVFGEVCLAEVAAGRRHGWHQALDLMSMNLSSTFSSYSHALLAAEGKESFW